MSSPRPADPASPQGSAESRWTRLGALDDFGPGTLTLVRPEGRHLVVARTEEGEVHCLDDRCPHEGYPLSQGALEGCALTCCWHNWKFDVRDGSCTLGEEGVRSFPARVVDGALEVDLRDPDPAAVLPGLRASFEEGLRRRELGRALREGIRMLAAGHPAVELLADVAVLDARHAEYGTTHVLPVAADLARLLGGDDGPDTMPRIAAALDLWVDTNARLPVRPAPEPAAGADGPGLRAAVEAEEVERAEALLRGAFRAGRTRAEVEAWLFAVLSDHFLDFGHELIYLVKARELLARVADPEARAAELYPALLHATVLGTREDTLPYLRPYARFLTEVEPELPEVWGRCRERARADVELDGLRDAVLDGRSEDALGALWTALRAGADLERVAGALVAAAAHRLLRYDGGLECDGSVAENFLWATHRLTFASAVRHAVRDFSEPDALRFLFQSLAFTHSGRAMDVPPADRRLPAPRAGGAGDVAAAIAARDPAGAVAVARSLLEEGRLDELRRTLEAFVLDDPVVRPIAVAHVLKTTVCALEESEAAADGPDRWVPVLAAVRTWALPLVERRVRRTAETSLRWVVGGEVPRKLTQ